MVECISKLLSHWYVGHQASVSWPGVSVIWYHSLLLAWHSQHQWCLCQASSSYDLMVYRCQCSDNHPGLVWCLSWKSPHYTFTSLSTRAKWMLHVTVNKMYFLNLSVCTLPFHPPDDILLGCKSFIYIQQNILMKEEKLKYHSKEKWSFKPLIIRLSKPPGGQGFF